MPSNFKLTYCNRILDFTANWKIYFFFLITTKTFDTHITIGNIKYFTHAKQIYYRQSKIHKFI